MLIVLLWKNKSFEKKNSALLKKLRQILKILNLGKRSICYWFFKTNPWLYKTKDLNEETIIENVYKKYLLLSKLQMSYYPKSNNHIRNKVKVVLAL